MRHPGFLPLLLSAALAGLLTASGVLWLGARGHGGDQPVAVARQQALNFFSLGHRHPDADIDRVLSLATGGLQSEYSARREAMKRGLVDKKLTLTAQVPDNGTGLEYQHADDAQVLVAVDATTKTADGRAETNRYRVRVRLVRTANGWLVSDLRQTG